MYFKKRLIRVTELKNINIIAFLFQILCLFDISPYLRTVFFIVLDLRLTKVGLSGALFLCLKVNVYAYILSII